MCVQVCVHMCLYTNAFYARHGCGGQRSVWGSWLSPTLLRQWSHLVLLLHALVSRGLFCVCLPSCHESAGITDLLWILRRTQVIGLARQVLVSIEPYQQPFCNLMVHSSLIFTIFSVLAYPSELHQWPYLKLQPYLLHLPLTSTPFPVSHTWMTTKHHGLYLTYITPSHLKPVFCQGLYLICWASPAPTVMCEYTKQFQGCEWKPHLKMMQDTLRSSF